MDYEIPDFSELNNFLPEGVSVLDRNDSFCLMVGQDEVAYFCTDYTCFGGSWSDEFPKETKDKILAILSEAKRKKKESQVESLKEKVKRVEVIINT